MSTGTTVPTEAMPARAAVSAEPVPARAAMSTGTTVPTEAMPARAAVFTGTTVPAEAMPTRATVSAKAVSAMLVMSIEAVSPMPAEAMFHMPSKTVMPAGTFRKTRTLPPAVLTKKYTYVIEE